MGDGSKADAETDGDTLEVHFRDAMRRLAGTVAIVTVDVDGERHGTTATAVTSLSMDPPSIIVCFNRGSRLHGYLSRADSFCVNILHADDIEIARLFAAPVSSAERFAVGIWHGPTGQAPALNGTQASILCRKDQVIDYGSHTIFIGRVTSVVNRADISPLVYRDGGYAATRPLT